MIRTSDHVHLASRLYTIFEGKGRVLRQGDRGYEIGEENDLGLVNREVGQQGSVASSADRRRPADYLAASRWRCTWGRLRNSGRRSVSNVGAVKTRITVCRKYVPTGKRLDTSSV